MRCLRPVIQRPWYLWLPLVIVSPSISRDHAVSTLHCIEGDFILLTESCHLSHSLPRFLWVSTLDISPVFSYFSEVKIRIRTTSTSVSSSFKATTTPLSGIETICILLIDLGTDLAPAVSLAYEEPEDSVMQVSTQDPFASGHTISHAAPTPRRRCTSCWTTNDVLFFFPTLTQLSSVVSGSLHTGSFSPRLSFYLKFFKLKNNWNV